MAFTEAERGAVRRYCGYPPYADGATGFAGWRFFQTYGLMEWRLSHLTASEEDVVRRYLSTLAQLETRAPTADAAHLAECARLSNDWRRRLCGFMGLQPGPALAAIAAAEGSR